MTILLVSWIGPEKQVRDFQFGRWSVEVKTTHGNNHQKVQISSERQLDTANTDNLFLNHLSLETIQQSGETLNQIVDSVSELLSINLSASNQFRNKLIEAGFFDPHRQYYSDIGYFIRQDIYYKVENQFPRIEETDIRKGVGDVKYSIIVSQCNDYEIPEQEVFKIIKFYMIETIEKDRTISILSGYPAGNENYTSFPGRGRWNLEQIFTQTAVDLLADAGETENVRVAYDESSLGRKNQHKINAYSISENYETIDLFITIYKGTDEITRIQQR